jgi:prepilin-type N-terminal cleavage/methylation domain-containing protein
MSMKLKNIKIPKKFWFTLLEMLVVLVIISIILWMTMYLGSENIFRLRYKTTKEDFLSTFNLFYTNSLESNYINQNRFDNLDLGLFSWKNRISYAYIWSSLNQTWEKKTNLLEISDIKIDSWVVQNQVSINIKPYKLWCDIKDITNHTWSRLDFKIIVNKVKTYCLYLLSQNCKIKEQMCP